mgnify:CR=1 FL=1
MQKDMKAVILAGGLGTRLSEETLLKPKPMVEIGGMPIIWHIMKIYSAYEINDFIICAGYKGHLIKEFFANYFLHASDIIFDTNENEFRIIKDNTEKWKVTISDTGAETMTGGRLKRVKEHIGNETFCFTYGDGLSNVNISELIQFHKKNKVKATLTAVIPPGRYGILNIEGESVKSFKEKPLTNQSWINGGFFVLEPSAIELISGDDCVWERQPLETLALNGELKAFKHEGFWQPMDNLRDKINLQSIWESGEAPWKIW